MCLASGCCWVVVAAGPVDPQAVQVLIIAILTRPDLCQLQLATEQESKRGVQMSATTVAPNDSWRQYLRESQLKSNVLQS